MNIIIIQSQESIRKVQAILKGPKLQDHDFGAIPRDQQNTLVSANDGSLVFSTTTTVIASIVGVVAAKCKFLVECRDDNTTVRAATTSIVEECESERL